ncbi:MAG TPA: glycosyltransferase family 2 protein [Candidatus Dorea intestinavium]|nr:glycosyltransferase family 2 protein [Candidatus Dorea intestinavium]
MKNISVVIPVFNEEENINILYCQICKYLDQLPYSYELIFIDDGSSDDTAVVLEGLVACDKKVRAILLARNFGHQVALTCGLDNAQGDAVITMDGDLQHPPELLPALIAKWEEGFEIVQTVRIDTEGASLMKKLTAKIFYCLINYISNLQMIAGSSDFRLLDKKVIQTFRGFKEKSRFIRGIIGDLGYRRINVEFVAPKRFAGKSKFSFKKMVSFALDGITAYSKLPLRIAFYLGLFFGIVSIGMTLEIMYIKFFTNEAVPGWTTIAASVLIFGGAQLVGLGIIGEYIGRIFEEVKQRPLYWVKSEISNKKALKIYPRAKYKYIRINRLCIGDVTNEKS